MKGPELSNVAENLRETEPPKPPIHWLKVGLVQSLFFSLLLGTLSWERTQSARGFVFGAVCGGLNPFFSFLIERYRPLGFRGFGRRALVKAASLLNTIAAIFLSLINPPGLGWEVILYFLPYLLLLGAIETLAEDLQWRERWVSMAGAAVAGAALGWPLYLALRDASPPILSAYTDPWLTPLLSAGIAFTATGILFLYRDRPKEDSPPADETAGRT